MAKKRTKYNAEVMRSYADLKRMYDNKYFNLFMNSIAIDGVSDIEKRYILKKFWLNGTVAMTPIKYAEGNYVYTPWSLVTYDMYGEPATIRLVNEFRSPLITNDTLAVNIDTFIGYLMPGKTPLCTMVRPYIEKLCNIDMVIGTNLVAHKMPLLVSVSPEDIDQANDIVDRLMANEPVIFTSIQDFNRIKAIVAGTPYIIDKLYQYKCAIEGELQTLLGIDNVGVITHTERALVDEVNSGNIITNAMMNGMIDNINVMFEAAGCGFKAHTKIEASVSTHESNKNDGGEDNGNME